MVQCTCGKALVRSECVFNFTLAKKICCRTWNGTLLLITFLCFSYQKFLYLFFWSSDWRALKLQARNVSHWIKVTTTLISGAQVLCQKLIFHLIKVILFMYFWLKDSQMEIFHIIFKFQDVFRVPTNCLSVFDHFVGLARKGLRPEIAYVCFHFLKRFSCMLSVCHLLSSVF